MSSVVEFFVSTDSDTLLPLSMNLEPGRCQPPLTKSSVDAPQISRLYSAIVLSEEKNPERAALRIDIVVQPFPVGISIAATSALGKR